MFIDDIFVILKCNQVEPSFTHINTVNPNIRFTIEKEPEDNIAFIDVSINKNENGTLKFKVYRKPTHTNRYLNYFSSHAVNQKRTVIEMLINIASTIISNSEDQIEERKIIFATSHENDYPDWFIKQTLQRRKHMNEINQEQKPQQDQRPNGVVILPFFPKYTHILSYFILIYFITNSMEYFITNSMEIQCKSLHKTLQNIKTLHAKNKRTRLIQTNKEEQYTKFHAKIIMAYASMKPVEHSKPV